MLLLKSNTSERSVDSAPFRVPTSAASRLYFHYASGFSTQILAYMLDSLVRVSRRVIENHFVSITSTQVSCRLQYPSSHQSILLHALTRVTSRKTGSRHKPRAIYNPPSTRLYPLPAITDPETLPADSFLQPDEWMLTHQP